MDQTLIIQALFETLYMTFVPMLFIAIIGFGLGMALFNSSIYGMKPNKQLYAILNITVNIFRSVPFIVLLVLMIPVTMLITGTMIGTEAMIPVLIVTGTPFFARVVENALKDVDSGLVEAGIAMGASKMQVMFKILVKEAIPSLIDALTLTTVSLIGYTAMAGTVGGGGLGYVAVRYGIHESKFDQAILVTGIIVLIVFVIEFIGNYASKKLNRK